MAGRVVLVHGEAGVGKTSLVNAFLASLSSERQVLRGACEPLTSPRPLGPLWDLVDSGVPLHHLLSHDVDTAAAFRELVRDLGRRPGSLLVFEDMHWADDATVDMLRFVVRRLGGVRTLLVMTYRNDEIAASHPLRLLLGEIAADPAVGRLSLAPLSERLVRELAADSNVDATRLWQRTRGNPFFVTEALAAGGSEIPETVSDFVLSRAGRLEPAARHLLDVAAVLEPAGDLNVLLRAARSEHESLDRCVDCGLLGVRDGVPSFRHELARVAVYTAIPPGRRAFLHTAVLAELAGYGAGPAVLAHHAAAAGDRVATRDLALKAAERAVQLGSHRQAAEQFARVLNALGANDDPSRVELMVRCSRELALSNQVDRATEQAERALTLARTLGDRRQEGDVLAWLSRLAWMSERVADAERLARSSVSLLEALPPGIELARAQATLAQQLATYFGRPEARTWAERALRTADDLGVEEIAAQATIDIGLVGALNGEFGATDLMRAGVELARDVGSDDPAARGLFQLVRVASVFLRHDELDRSAAEAETFCDERGAEFWGDYSRAFRTQSLTQRSLWSEAIRVGTDVLNRTDEHSPTVRTITTAVAVGLARLRRGDADPDELLELAGRRAEPLGEPVGFGLWAARAERAWLTGELDAIVDALRDAWTRRPRTTDGWWNAEMWWWLHVAEAPEAAERPTGFAASVAGDWSTAATGFEHLGLPYYRALALAESGEEEQLRRALHTARALGAVPLARLVARRLRAIGARDIPRIGRAERSDTELTRREHDVLALLADGLRDAEIARRLHVSDRTVNHHVSAILRKLHSPSRTAAVAHAHRTGLVSPPER